MARGIRIVDPAQIVQEIDDIYIAYNGQVRQISELYVADAGVVRQCWPKDVINVTGIVMDTAAETSYAVADATARAICNYDARTGKIILSNGTTTKEIQAISPAPRAQGNYLMKFDIVSGDIQANDPTGSWVDVNSEGTLGLKEYWLQNTVVGAITGEATLTFAEDDGAGAPAVGTEVAKTINFTAEVLSERITMTTNPWTLSNTEVNEKAEVFLLTVPAGWYSEVTGGIVEHATLSGEFGFPKGIQIQEIYTLNWNETITVQVDVVSGTVLGEATGVPLSTNVRRIWYIEQDAEGSNSATVNITITDGFDSVTKQVVMTAEYVLEQTDPDSDISDDFTRTDAASDTDSSVVGGLKPTVEITLLVKPNGTIDLLTGYPFPQQVSGFPQNWNTAATSVPDPQNYECKIFVNQGDSLWPSTGYSSQFWLSNWLNLGTEAKYTHHSSQNTTNPGTVTKSGTWLLGIREVGRPETVKYKTLQLSTQTQVTT